MEKFLMEGATLKSAFLPVDANTAAITGARVSLANAQRCAVVVHMGDSTAAVVTLTLRKHTAASAGTSADLSVAHPYYHKAGAATSFTKVVPGSAAAAYDLAALFADAEGIVVFEVLAEDLGEGYTHFSLDVADSTAAKLVGGVYVLQGVRNCSAHDLIA